MLPHPIPWADHDHSLAWLAAAKAHEAPEDGVRVDEKPHSKPRLHVTVTSIIGSGLVDSFASGNASDGSRTWKSHFTSGWHPRADIRTLGSLFASYVAIIFQNNCF